MKLNRSHALLLVGTIAAAGCVVKESDDDGNGGEGGEGSGAKGGTGGTAGSSKGGSAGTAAGKAGSGGSAGKGYAGNAGKAGSSSTAGTSNVAGAGGEGGDDTGNGGVSSVAGAGGEGGAAECNDLDAAAVSCGGLSSASCDIASFLDDECAMFWQVMKPGAANRARECMLDLKQSALCDATNTYDCIDKALKASCPDPTVAADCEGIVSSCAEGGTAIAAEDCSAYMNGLNEAGRYQFVSCMTGTTYCDLHSCAEGLTYPSAE
jgi:hypothetical protein